MDFPAVQLRLRSCATRSMGWRNLCPDADPVT